MRTWQATCVCFREEKESHCSFKLVTMMFKTHKIWFPPEFALHLENMPTLHSALPSYPHGFKPFIYACVFVHICFPSSCTISEILLSDKDCAPLIPLSTDGLPPIFSLCSVMQVWHVPSNGCIICIWTHVLRLLAIDALNNISSLISNKSHFVTQSCHQDVTAKTTSRSVE